MFGSVAIFHRKHRDTTYGDVTGHDSVIESDVAQHHSSAVQVDDGGTRKRIAFYIPAHCDGGAIIGMCLKISHLDVEWHDAFGLHEHLAGFHRHPTGRNAARRWRGHSLGEIS